MYVIIPSSQSVYIGVLGEYTEQQVYHHCPKEYLRVDASISGSLLMKSGKLACE